MSTASAPQADSGKPVPKPSALSKPFWEAARRHELQLQRCNACGTYIFYPRNVCPRCWSSDLTWTPVSGQGTVYSFTIVRRAASRRFAADVPYVLAAVQLAEGPKMMTNIVGCPVDAVRVGLPVEVTFEDRTPAATVVLFKPAEGG